MPLTVRVTGGHNLARFIFQDGNVDAAISAAIGVIRSLVLPRLRAAVPFRSGRLRNTLHVARVGDAIQLRGVFYARMVRWNNGRHTVEELFIQLVRSHKAQIIAAVRAAISGGI